MTSLRLPTGPAPAPPRRTGAGPTTGPSRPQLAVDLAAVAANTRRFAGLGAALMAVVKADAFGHGATAAARVALANGATWLGVTSLDEALALRSARVAAPLLSWLNPVDADFAGALVAGVDLAVPGLEHLRAVADAAAATGRTARLHLHADVGMARDGAPAEVWPELCRRARALEGRGVVRVVGVMGHLGAADQPDDPANAADRATFAARLHAARAAGLQPRVRHLAATAATLTQPAARLDLVRVGAGLFGIDPTGSETLSPALTLTAPVVSVRDAAAGTGVGYGHAWRAASPTRLALLPVGYADGIPRGSRGEVALHGRRCPVVGRVSMDQVVVDAGDLPVCVGDVATVFGPGASGEPTVAEWAAWSDTIAHEIITGIGPRVHRSTSLTPLRGLR